MSRPPLGDPAIGLQRNEVFLLPTRLIASNRDLEEDLSDVSFEEGILEEAIVDEMFTKEHEGTKVGKEKFPKEPTMIEMLDRLGDRLGYDIDGRDSLDDDELFDTFKEASGFSPIIYCGESYEMECIALWDYFGGNNYDGLNVHAGDVVNVVAEEYQVRVFEKEGTPTYIQMPFQWSLARWMSERSINPYLGLIPSHYIVSKQFYDDHPLLFKWSVWYHGNAEIHEVVRKLYSDRSALCAGLFAIFSPAWLNIDLDEHRCFFLMILTERDKGQDDKLEELIKIERQNYGIMANAVNYFYGEMLPQNVKKERTTKMQCIDFMSEIQTTPFEPAIVTIHRSSLGHYELMGKRYDTLYDLVHHLSTDRSALPHKLVYCRSSPSVVGRNFVPPPTPRFQKDLRCQPMAIEQWAATHFDDVTRRFECGEKTLFATKTVFDGEKKHHERLKNRLNLSKEEKELVSSYMKNQGPQKKWENMPLHETSIRINSLFYVDGKKIDCGTDQIGKGAFGTVKKGKFRNSLGESVPVAVKKLGLRESSKDERNPAFSEMEILEMVAHPNIVFYYGFSISGDEQALYLLFELMDTSLDKFIDKSDAILSENERLDILAQICRGMSFLHTRTPSIVHGDLAARNVLLKKHPVYIKKYICKITDLGLAKTCLDELYTSYDDPTKIPFKWLPPEVLGSRTLSLKTDIWAFGIVCFEVCDKVGEPYGACVPTSNLCQYLTDGYVHEKGLHMSDTIYNIALDCMRQHPIERPSFAELVDQFLDHLIENDGEDVLKLKAREKIIAEKMRKERMLTGLGKLLAED